jgi:formylglycine-generating enzyme required for sulfatase activity
LIEAQEEGHAAARYIRVCPLKRHAGSELLQRKIEYYSTGVIARIASKPTQSRHGMLVSELYIAKRCADAGMTSGKAQRRWRRRLTESEKLKVFISYSRKDSTDFADELVAGLELAGFAPFIDRHDIAAGEDWEARLGGLIQGADTVIYVISPESVKSDRCSWEINKTVSLSKRLLPIVFKSVSDSDIPEQLRRLQFIRFDLGLGLTRPLAQLADALRQDIEWIREHTRIAELAARWQLRGKPQSLLLRADELDAAREWTLRRNPEALAITELQRTFLKASEQEEGLRLAASKAAQTQRIRVRLILLLLAAIIVIGPAAWWKQAWLKEQVYWVANVRGHVLTAETQRTLKTGDSFKECTDCPEMVVVPADTFTMGSSPGLGASSEQPAHQVTITYPFAVGKFELTFEEWDACSTYGDCDPHISTNGWGRGRQPVINLTWNDALRYLAWLSRVTGQHYRILTEAEWEYAARGKSLTHFSFGNDESPLDQYGWYASNSDHHTHPVGEKKPNPFGLYDIHGNVSEWVEDCYHDGYRGAPSDGSAWLSGNCTRRVARGGSWLDRARSLRSATRDWYIVDQGHDNLGLRVARTLAH